MLKQLLTLAACCWLASVSAQISWHLGISSDYLDLPFEELRRPGIGESQLDYDFTSVGVGIGGEVRWTSADRSRTISLHSNYSWLLGSEINAQFTGRPLDCRDPDQRLLLVGQARLVAANYWRTGIRVGIGHEPKAKDLRIFLGAGVLAFFHQRTHFAVAAVQERERGFILEVPPCNYAFRIEDARITARPLNPGERQLDLEGQMLRPLTGYAEAGFGFTPLEHLDIIFNFQFGVAPAVDRSFYQRDQRLRGWFAISIQAQGRVK